MKYIALMNTAIFSFNQGDYIIMESVKRELDYLLKDSFVVEIPTHSPMFHVTEFGIGKKNSFYDKLQKFDYKFVCGTNLLHHNMKYAKTTWNINIIDTKYFGDMILLGVGTDPKDEAVNRYTRKLYNQVLAKDVIHSTRDERTKKLLESMGFKAINTGCATMWGLTPEHCSKIPTEKSDTVVFTLTDYAMDYEKDKRMVEILKRNYSNKYFWIQGSQDQEYLESLTDTRDITYINPLLKNYHEFLTTKDCDYVGTRLHAGIKAMQLLKRSIIIGVDNRSEDITKTYKLNYVLRENIDELDQMINERIITDINIDTDKISAFLQQFTA